MGGLTGACPAETDEFAATCRAARNHFWGLTQDLFAWANSEDIPVRVSISRRH